MKIAYVITRADAVGGASIHVRDLAAAMRTRGHDVRVFVGGTGPVTRQLASEGTPFVSLQHLQRSINPIADARAYGELAAALRHYAPDLISAHTAKAGWLGRRAAAGLGIPAIYTPHGWTIGDRMSPLQGRIYTAAERIAAPWSAAVVCVCEYERRLALSKLPALGGRLHVIYNGVRETGLRASVRGCPVRLISVARFEPPKDHATLIEAMSLLRDLSWELQLVGDGPLQSEAGALVARFGIAARTNFTGYSPDPAPCLAQSQIFVLCSRSEGFPRSILEAMRAGLPVVASDVGGIGEAVRDGENGRLVPRGSPAALADALRPLILDELERQRLGGNGHLIFQRRFKLEETVDRTAALYDTVIQSGSAQAHSS